MEENKTILRAIAGTVKFHAKEVFEIVKRFDSSINENPSLEELVSSVVILYDNSEEFYEAFTNFMIRKDQLQKVSDFNNAIDPISAIAQAVGQTVGAIGNVVSSVVNLKSTKVNAEAKVEVATYEYGAEVQGTTQEILRLMQTDTQLEMAEKKSNTGIVLTIIGISGMITAITLYKIL